MSTTAWTEGRVDALLAALDSYGMSMSPAAAEDLIVERVDAVAQLMRATKATARRYLTDEAIAASEAVVEITQYGSTRSINASAAAAVAMYAWVQQHSPLRPR